MNMFWILSGVLYPESVYGGVTVNPAEKKIV